jgi:glycosyltransferase involved in cell wall biosynthesis
MDRSRVAIVIPALNESSTIAEVVKAAIKYGIPIVVDDGSTDGTSDFAHQAGGTVISHGCNRGYDAALASGFKKASEIGFDLIITLDADGQHDPSLIQKYIEKVDAGADVVVGIRSMRQRLAEHVFAWYTGCRYGINDPLCGMKAYKKKVYQALGHFDSYGSIGTELMLFAAKNSYRLDEVPFVVRERSGTSRFGKVLSGNYKIFRAMLLSFWRV